MRRIELGIATIFLTCFVCSGCGERWHAETYPAIGRITVNGQPPVGALVQLHTSGDKPDIRNSRPWGVVKEDGSYSLSTYEAGDGAPAGEYVLTITWPCDVSKPSLDDRLNHAYAMPEQSKWQLTVAEGTNELPLVEITGAQVEQQLSPQQAIAPMPGINNVGSDY